MYCHRTSSDKNKGRQWQKHRQLIKVKQTYPTHEETLSTLVIMNTTQLANLTSFANNLTSTKASNNQVAGKTFAFSAHLVVLIVIYSVIFTCGVTGNITIICFFSRKVKKTLYDSYIIHLAIADLLAAFFTPFRVILSMLMFKNGLSFSETTCKAISAIEPITVNASAWILTSIAIERYRGIVLPLRRRYSRIRIHSTVCIIWVASIIFYIPYINSTSTTFKRKHCLSNWRSPYGELAFNITVLCVQSLIPLGIMCYTISKIAESLKERNLIRRMTNQKFTKEVTLLLILKVAFALFLVCTLPYNIFYILLVVDMKIFKSLHRLPLYQEANDWLAILVVFSTVTNCFVYARLHRGFAESFFNCSKGVRHEKISSSRRFNTLITDKHTHNSQRRPNSQKRENSQRQERYDTYYETAV